MIRVLRVVVAAIKCGQGDGADPLWSLNERVLSPKSKKNSFLKVFFNEVIPSAIQRDRKK